MQSIMLDCGVKIFVDGSDYEFVMAIAAQYPLRFGTKNHKRQVYFDKSRWSETKQQFVTKHIWLHRIIAGAVKAERVEFADKDPLNLTKINLRRVNKTTAAGVARAARVARAELRRQTRLHMQYEDARSDAEHKNREAEIATTYGNPDAGWCRMRAETAKRRFEALGGVIPPPTQECEPTPTPAPEVDETAHWNPFP